MNNKAVKMILAGHRLSKWSIWVPGPRLEEVREYLTTCQNVVVIPDNEATDKELEHFIDIGMQYTPVGYYYGFLAAQFPDLKFIKVSVFHDELEYPDLVQVGPADIRYSDYDQTNHKKRDSVHDSKELDTISLEWGWERGSFVDIQYFVDDTGTFVCLTNNGTPKWSTYILGMRRSDFLANIAVLAKYRDDVLETPNNYWEERTPEEVRIAFGKLFPGFSEEDDVSVRHTLRHD